MPNRSSRAVYLKLMARSLTMRRSEGAWISSFWAPGLFCLLLLAWQAAVLVLVYGLLDYFMMKGHIELGWIAGALLISVALLALSIVIELSAQRWIKAHP